MRYISKLENSAQNVTLEVVENLTKGLDCSLYEIFEINEKPKGKVTTNILAETIRQLQDLYSRISN